MIRTLALACICALLCACSKQAPESSNGDVAKRVVTFAPHLSEIMFAIGAGDRLVGVSSWSDYPREVLELPEVGDAFTVDQEQLALLDPDLLLVWESGMPAHTVDELRGRGYRVEAIRTRSLADVSAAMIRLGELTGQRATAEAAAEQYTVAFDRLSDQYRDAEPITVFFQISTRPLYTINREHFISEIISICGGRNVFDDLDEMAPSVSVEAVLDRDPEVMLAGANLGDDAFADWARWQRLAANRYGNQFLLSDETIGRPIPRLVIAGQAVCVALDQARRNRAAAQ
ncbi:MAG: ABC transporter substrate-binding protein [Gammaproteobacteria bacterium]|nr:ABC transporter substrate-binding protein [Gammaproteobacteria bacterium]